MTIEEVLHTVSESGLVNGYPEDLGANDTKGISFGGPRNGSYVLLSVPGREVSPVEGASLLRQDMVRGFDYNIGFTFTLGVGPHWSMTVFFSPEGRFKGVKPFHTWVRSFSVLPPSSVARRPLKSAAAQFPSIIVVAGHHGNARMPLITLLA
jgi:hypothetical protein